MTGLRLKSAHRLFFLSKDFKGINEFVLRAEKLQVRSFERLEWALCWVLRNGCKSTRTLVDTESAEMAWSMAMAYDHSMADIVWFCYSSDSSRNHEPSDISFRQNAEQQRNLFRRLRSSVCELTGTLWNLPSRLAHAFRAWEMRFWEVKYVVFPLDAAVPLAMMGFYSF